MIDRLQDSAFMREKVQLLRNLARDFADWLTGASTEEFPDEEVDRLDVEEMIMGLDRLERDIEFWEPASRHWMPHDSDAAILQSSMDEYYRLNQCVDKDENMFGEALIRDPLGTENVRQLQFGGRRPAGRFQFNAKDPRWVLVAQALGIKKRRGPAQFIDNTGASTSFDIDSRMVLFGDWASGLPNAQQLADEVWRSHLQPELGKRQLHVIHLGDAYYAGLPRDYARRFTPYWPVPSGQNDVSSWCVPGNHDMYSGGHGFFQMLNSDHRFSNQNGRSYFLLENSYWQVFGLDTAFDPPDLKGDIGDMYGEQAAWVAQKREAAPDKKCLLLTHHQPFSAYAIVHEMLERRLRPIRTRDQITAWFWGHEHYCAAYKTHDQIRYPVLLGHGGFPERPKSQRGGAPPLDFEWTFTDATHFLIFGFAVLDFYKDQIEVRLVDKDGTPRHHFAIT